MRGGLVLAGRIEILDERGTRWRDSGTLHALTYLTDRGVSYKKDAQDWG
jgi:hypothetical protein